MKHRFKNLLSHGAHYVCPWKSKEVSSNSTCGRAAIACFPTAEPPALTSDTSLENIFISPTSFLKCTVVIRMINTHGCFLCLFILFEVHPAPWIVMICEFYKCLGKKKSSEPWCLQCLPCPSFLQSFPRSFTASDSWVSDTLSWHAALWVPWMLWGFPAGTNVPLICT